MPESKARTRAPNARKRTRTIPQVKVVVVGSFCAEDGKSCIISGPEDVAKLRALDELMKQADREVFVALHLSTKNHLISWEVISVGSLNASIVHPRELFKGAILANAAGVVVVHNHPSGDATPSGADIQLTKRLVKAGDVLGIEVLDHVVFGEEEVMSLRDLSLM
jgi:DNA repair protein RadC